MTRRTRIRRREFLAAGLAAAGVLLAPRTRAQSQTVDVAVVGAGLAGLNAAMILAEAGANVLVLEGAERPGGRCLTAADWHRSPELGASQIGPMYARVRDAAAKLGVKLAPGAHVNAPYSFVVDGRLIAAKNWAGSPLNRTVGRERQVPPHALQGFYIEQRSPFETLDAWLAPDAERHDVSLAEWLKRQEASGEAMRIIRATQGGLPLEKLSVLRMLQEATRSKVDVRSMADDPEYRGKDVYERFALASSHVVGGTSALTAAMAASLGDRVRFGHRVRTIEMDGSGCTVACENGTRVRAGHAIAAVPFTTLRDIDIRPAPPPVQREAVGRMPYGNQSQVWLRVRAPYWEQDGIEASMWSDGPLTLIRQQIEHDGARELVSALAFGAKSRKLDAMPVRERGAFVIAHLEKIRPSMRGKLEFVGAHSWEEMPLVRGCSHQLEPGRAFEWAQAMIRPHGQLHFAGEHTRRLEVGMEAAMESGERAAIEILERRA